MSEKFGSHDPKRPEEHSFGVCPNSSDPIDETLSTFTWDMLMNHLNRAGINADNNKTFALLFCGEVYPGRYGAFQQLFTYAEIPHATYDFMEEKGINLGRGVIKGINTDKANTPHLAFLLFDLEEEPVYLTGYVFKEIH